MQQWLEFVTVLILLSNLAMLGFGELGACVRLVAAQGILLGIFTLIVRADGLTVRLLLLAMASMALKGYVFPYL